MNKVLALTFIIFSLISCTSKTPKELALSYCDCIKNSSDVQKCTDLEIEHLNILGDDKDKMGEYYNEIANFSALNACLCYEEVISLNGVESEKKMDYCLELLLIYQTKNIEVGTEKAFEDAYLKCR